MAIRIKKKGAVMTPNEQRKYDESIVKLENILGKENLERLTGQLVACHGDQLEGKLMDALTHLDRTYSVESAGELLEAGHFSDIDMISKWSSEGEKAELDFPSMRGESRIERKEDYDDEVGLDFPSMDE